MFEKTLESFVDTDSKNVEALLCHLDGALQCLKEIRKNESREITDRLGFVCKDKIENIVSQFDKMFDRDSSQFRFIIGRPT